MPDGFVVRFLGRQRKATFLFAVVAGFLMSACSHGMLAIAIQLYNKGASVPAVITFLLASLWVNLPMTFLHFGFFGWHALLIIGAAMLVALTTGFAFTLLDQAGLIEPASPSVDPGQTEWTRTRNLDVRDAGHGIAAGAMSLANMML